MEKYKEKIYLVIFVVFLSANFQYAKSQDASEKNLDDYLLQRAQNLSIQALNSPPLEKKNRDLFKLGEKLFSDPNLSGNKNISCSTCHEPTQGTGDGLPLSLGEGGKKIIQRNSPPLYNLSEFNDSRPLFWDGRVHYNFKEKRLIGPLDSVSEVTNTQEYQEILKTLSSPLAMQALFPLISKDEMLGERDENPLMTWENILERIKNDPAYKDLLQKSFSSNILNIAHLTNAIAHFITYEFSRTQTPLDRYLRGDLRALTLNEKKGMKVFLFQGQCFLCHNGPELSNFSFINIGIPILENSEQESWKDFGRFNITGNQYNDLHKFRTAPLRNISLTGPYMHNGVFKDLDRVIEHYNDPLESLVNYLEIDLETNIYQDKIYVLKNLEVIKDLSAVDMRVSGRLDLSTEDKLLLKTFLTKSLTQ